MRMNRIALASLLLSFLGRAAPSAPQDSAGVWLDVPYVKQSEDGCGSAVISMLLQYWNAHGAHVDSQRADATLIQNQLYSRKARGIFASDMQADLQEQLKQGRPLIVSLQPGSAKSPLHFVVVTGIGWQTAAVFINDPAQGKLLRIARANFEKQWRPNHNWMLLILPEKAV